MVERKDRILGSLLGAAIGDAMGAATELRTRRGIEEKFGGPVTEILQPPDDTFAHGAQAGSVTDDFSLIYHTAKAIIANGGRIDEKAAEQALLSWSGDANFFDQYAGPTTRAAILRIRGLDAPNPYDFLACDNAKASNGSAMKISPAGLFHPGDPEAAVESAVAICRPTHNNNLSMAGAGAVAAAVSEAMTDGADLYSVVQAALAGACRAAELVKGTADVLAGPDVAKRIEMAVSIGLTAPDLSTAMDEIADRIGTGLHISEAVPAVFGLLVAAKGEPMPAIIAAVNVGSDTDTIATMLGAIVGAMHGASSFSPAYLELINRVNHYDLQALAAEIDGLVR